MSGKRKPVLEARSVEDDSLTEVEDCSSPDSCGSGPTYGPRRPGFKHHAHHKNKNKPEPLPPRPQVKRDPLPMKLRALPHSFWVQPNKPANVSPGSVYPVLPPLTRDTDSSDNRPEMSIVTAANTDLLFSLFKGVEQEVAAIPPLRRNRPKKTPSTLMARVLKDDDPCLGSAADHAALPLLRQPTFYEKIPMHSQVLTMPTRDCEKTMLPSLDNSYSQLLSELVIRL
ncbi:uncharacterized protein LOC132200282 [Neocloeon triangulifer]|uniref:uncharacterized protein LOC132200282 n=1 Tax=Neocloeon triangulifer TaxID=2078957 RepID=UPI00286F94A8|nr:uncharacterized protein LOC132200282 [Neocloeon triangulifer]